MTNKSFQELQDAVAYTFRDPRLLERALTHSSTGGPMNYERLEFLGDRVLGLVMAHIVFETFQDENEGGLAKRHAALVQGRALAEVAIAHDLGDFITMSESERGSGGAEKETILADALEALLGAVYLDGGLEPVESLIRRMWGDAIHTLSEAPQDPKTELQELVQSKGLPLPVYEISGRSGPDHAPQFEIRLNVKGFDPVTAQGPSRRQAEKAAARFMLDRLKK